MYYVYHDSIPANSNHYVFSEEREVHFSHEKSVFPATGTGLYHAHQYVMKFAKAMSCIEDQLPNPKMEGKQIRFTFHDQRGIQFVMIISNGRLRY